MEPSVRQELECLESGERQGFVFVAMHSNNMRIAYDNNPECKKGEIAYKKTPYSWTRTELGDLALALNIVNIELPSGKVVHVSEFKTRTPLQYPDVLRSLVFPYANKCIFLLRQTKLLSLFSLFAKQKYVVLAKANKKTKINIDVLKIKMQRGDKEVMAIPMFTDSNEMNAFIRLNSKGEKQAEVINEYKPLLLKFKKIRRYLENEECIICNPCSVTIAGKNFSFTVTPSLLEKYDKSSLGQR